ncbi:MAG: CoA transferase [Chloroflexota bacterium]|nr:CoA transferase [Chloroflexota bacterium]
MSRALEHVRILDFTRALAGPFCTLKLAQLGADVIKVEIPGEGDGSRTNYPQTEGGESYLFITGNRGKRSITLNLATEKGHDICERLVQKVDAVVENFSPGVMDRLGIGYDRLSRVKPDLVYASLSGFGHTGPYSSRPAYDTVVQAMGGLISLTGFPDGPPTMVGVSIADMLTGLFTAIAILAALQHRAVTGEGQYIDMSMQDCTWDIAAHEALASYLGAGEAPVKKGNRYMGAFGVFPARDGNVVINVVTGGQWERLLQVMGRHDLLRADAYGNRAERRKHASEINALVEEWTSERTVEEVCALLSDAHLPTSPVPTFEQLTNDPHLLSRNMLVEVDQMVSGKVKTIGSPFKLSRTPGDATLPAPFLGQHNQEVYGGLLGYNDEQLAQLVDEGVI